MDDSDINILLLGETGVGKSTFINSFANYVQSDTLDAALEKELVCLIPTKFTIPDENYVERYVEIGKHSNENQEIGKSSTQGTRSYVFPLESSGRNIRLIDTPGIGDARGIAQDNTNFENILEYLSQFKHLHAICFLLKPNVSIITAYFKFCILHLLSRLERSAINNIIFVFTNTRSTLYRPGETLTVLRKILNEIQSKPPNVQIPCGKRNMFCVDNEAFRFLVALKNNFEFSKDERDNFSASWEISVRTCTTMLEYIAGSDERESIKPHLVQNILSVNEARRIITDLSKPLVDISDMIQDNVTVLDRHKTNISKDNMSIDDFKKNLYVPAVHLRQKELTQPVTVCTDISCVEKVTVAGIVKYHYKQRCHNPCYLSNVPREHVGAQELLNCYAMRGGQSCNECNHHFSTHMHILYETETFAAKEENEAVKKKISSTQDQIKAKSDLMATLNARKKEYEDERDVITKSLAKFAHFLKEHAITIFNDAYEDYLEYLIGRENNLGSNADSDFIKRHQMLKKQYQQEKQLLETCFKNSRGGGGGKSITTKEIRDCVQNLYRLKHTGKDIKELHEKQQRMRKLEHVKQEEYRHPRPIMIVKGAPKTTRYSRGDSSDSDSEPSDVERVTKLFGNWFRRGDKSSSGKTLTYPD